LPGRFDQARHGKFRAFRGRIARLAGADGDRRAVPFLPNRRTLSMRKVFSVKMVIVCGLLGAGLLVAATARQAQARPLYSTWWSQTYESVVKKNGVGKTVAKCNVCHIGTKDKKQRNEYAKAIEKALDGSKNLKKKDDFVAALKKVEEQKNGNGSTFGDLLKKDELPAKPQ
jgi:hypothetical protein